MAPGFLFFKLQLQHFFSIALGHEERPDSKAGCCTLCLQTLFKPCWLMKVAEGMSQSLCHGKACSVHPGHCHAGGLGHQNCQGCQGTGQRLLEDKAVPRKGIILWISKEPCSFGLISSPILDRIGLVSGDPHSN